MRVGKVMRITPLDGWAGEMTGGDLAGYQLRKLNETLLAAQSGIYYRRTLPGRVESLSDLRLLPTIDSETLTQNGTGLVCVPQDAISRVVTLTTSGSTGAPKRIYFTEEDQELTIDYFANGLQTVVKPGETMAILMPCERPGGVGDLIARSLKRIPVSSVRYGLVSDLAPCAEMLGSRKPEALVGMPVQVLALARYCEAMGIKTGISAVLLSADHIPDIARRELRRIWGCRVYEHYGMTEMGLGGAIDCDAHDGYHIRENDLLFEILDEKGSPLADGVFGEVAFTTLTRRGMPLIRYRTGDISCMLPGRCGCGSELRRIAPIRGRIGRDIVADCGTVIRMRDFDEVLFTMPCTSDFRLTASPRENLLKIEIEVQESIGKSSAEEITKLLQKSGLTGGLKVEIDITNRPNALSQWAGKRTVLSHSTQQSST